jgi:hypothetical protein
MERNLDAPVNAPRSIAAERQHPDQVEFENTLNRACPLKSERRIECKRQMAIAMSLRSKGAWGMREQRHV